MGNTIIGNGKKKHAELYVGGNLVGRVVYYYWSEDNNLIRLHDKNKYILAQFFRGKIDVLLEEEDIEDAPYYDGD